LRELIAARDWRRIGECEWNEIFTAIPDISAAALQRLEIPVDPPWCGVRQHTLKELEVSLLAMSEVYAARPDLRRFCRDRVIEARRRAHYASRNRRTDEEKRTLKAEMAQWMLIWLGDPALFAAWVSLRIDVLKNSMGVVILLG
jgi:hypothetical protein